MEIEVYNVQGEKTGKQITLNEEVFGVEPNHHAIYMAVKQYLANHRQGTHSTKERNAVSGSTRKIKKQKGTGTARAGSIKSPLFRGGGTVFGPHPRDYSFRLNKKLKRLASKSALSAKLKDGELIVLEDFTFEERKTKNFVSLLKKLELEDKKTTFILPEVSENVYFSSRNIPNTKVRRADTINTYELLDNKKLVLSEGSENDSNH
ncbi:MAG: 50S ribosomal protein L4 [Bacteroidetes bacterium]|nr:MAG: 50S ribosomal protein L4 [Bacteroidota bacterium]